MVFDRRVLLSGLSMAAAVRGAKGQPAASGVINLWPGIPPGAPGPDEPEKTSATGAITNIATPRLNVYRPARPDGTAVIVIAGGGYARVEAGRESAPICRWLQDRGTTAFELIYRLPRENRQTTAPFQDAQRAMRMVRGLASTYGISPSKIGVIGFSAGGHLAGMTAVTPDEPLYGPVDALDSLPARPDFCGLLYPVLSMVPPWGETHTRRELLGARPGEAASAFYSVERRAGTGTPPIFLAHAADDTVVAPENSLMMFAALRAAHATVELHVFQSGGHGWGMGQPGSSESLWPLLLQRWTVRNALMPAAPDTAP